jgi:hypothetical protein
LRYETCHSRASRLDESERKARKETTAKHGFSDARKALAAQLERAGVRSIEGVERMVDEGRN